MGRRRHSEPGGPFRDGTGPEAPTRVTRHTLSRREALAVLGTIGITTAGAELGTSAYFSDRETCENNRLVAGELDLKAAYSAHYSHWSADEDGSTTGIGDDVSVRMYGGPAGTTGDAGNAGLVGDVPAERGGGRGRNCFSAGTTHSAALARWVPVDHGNERQSDSATFSLGRSAEQCRHSEAAGTESAASPEGRELDARSGPTDVGGSDDESQYGSAVDVGDGVSAVGAPGDDGGRGQAVEFARRDPEDGDSDRGIRAAPDGHASTPRERSPRRWALR